MKSKLVLFFLFVLFAGTTQAQKGKTVIQPKFILYFDSVPNGGVCSKTSTTLSLRSVVNPKELSDFRITAVEMWMGKSKTCSVVSGDELSNDMKLALQATQSGDEVWFNVKAVNSEKIRIMTTGKFTVK